MSHVRRVQVFVDWDTARRIVRADARRGRRSLVERAIGAIQDSLADLLMARHPNGVFRVTMRVYHGWHRGLTATEDWQKFEEFRLAFRTGRTIGKVSFAPEIEYGHQMLCNSRRGRLMDTVRRRQDGLDEQKMVDTALISDILHYTRYKDGDMVIVVGDDDDLLPGVFTAEAWGMPIFVARLRAHDNQHVNTDGLIERLRQS